MTGLMPAVPPRSGSDTWDLIENALRELAERRGRWPGDPLTTITMLASPVPSPPNVTSPSSMFASRTRTPSG